MIVVREGGMNLLLAADEDYHGGDDTSELIALRSVWGALRNLASYRVEAFQKYQLLAVIDTGHNTLTKLLTVTGSIAPQIMERVFHAMSNVMMKDCLTADDFDEVMTADILSNSLVNLQNLNGGWKQEPILLIAGLRFLKHCFFKQKIFCTRWEIGRAHV